MHKTIWFILPLFAVLAGCAGMDKSECVTADWRTIGFEDGANGKPETAIGEYRQDCAGHGVAPDLSAYQQGHREGAERFCTHRNGFIVGKRGSSYQNSCPAELEEAFLPAYRDGKELYNLQRALSNARSAVDKQQRLLRQLEKDISVKTELLVEDGLVKEERVAILADIETLKGELIDAAQRVPQLERDVRRAENAYAQAEQRFAHYQ
jgi:hypothetical protein